MVDKKLPNGSQTLVMRLAALLGPLLLELFRAQDGDEDTTPVGDRITEERANVFVLVCEHVSNDPYQRYASRDDAQGMALEEAALGVVLSDELRIVSHARVDADFACRVKPGTRVQSERPFMNDVRRGLIIVNTGPGKGKTTAAMGTALRAVGNGMRVLMLQFLKGSWHYGELDAVETFGDKFVMKQMGRGFVKVGGAETDPEDVRMVEDAWHEAEQAILSGQWDLIVLDEINYAISYGMLDPAKVVEVLKRKPEMVHVILTGRNAHPTIVELADTVTEMREVKHAYQKGVLAQRGIEY